jgi:hypothetical protein
MSICCIGFLRTVEVHQCTDARISREKSHLVSPNALPGAASMRDIAIHMSFHHREIGGDAYVEAQSRIAVA